MIIFPSGEIKAETAVGVILSLVFAGSFLICNSKSNDTAIENKEIKLRTEFNQVSRVSDTLEIMEKQKGDCTNAIKTRIVQRDDGNYMEIKTMPADKCLIDKSKYKVERVRGSKI